MPALTVVAVLEGRIMNAKAKHEIVPFEVGRYYVDELTGFKIRTLCEVDTTTFGKALIVETNANDCVIMAVKNDKETWARFKEITETEWLSEFMDIKYN